MEQKCSKVSIVKNYFKGVAKIVRIPRSTALEVFGLKEDFSESDLKREYRRLVKIVHPDTGGDEQLFKFIDSCKNILINGEDISENVQETNNQNVHKKSNHESNSYSNNTKSEKKDAVISLEVLDSDYPNYIEKKEKEYNIVEIAISLVIYIQPRFRKKFEKCIIVKTVIPYSNFNKQLGIVKFNQTIKIPKEIQKFRRFKVRVKFLNDTFEFNVADGDFKVIEHAEYEYVKCLKSICELHFEK